MMKVFCFVGIKRFNDIQKLKRKDVVFGEDNRVKVWMARSKTDSKREGCQFVLTKSKISSVSVMDLVQWYLKSLGDISEEAFIFPVFRKGKPVGGQAVSYCAARKQLVKERELLGLGEVTWHSGRIGGATEASKKGSPGASSCGAEAGGRWPLTPTSGWRMRESGWGMLCCEP